MQIMMDSVLCIGVNSPEGIRLLGTGFMFETNGHIVTNRHVVSAADKELLVLAPNFQIRAYQNTSAQIKDYHIVSAKLIEIDPLRDLAILKCDARIEGLPKVTGLDASDVGTELVIMGYPHCTDGRLVLTYQTSVLGAKVLINSGGVDAKYGVVNVQTRPGQSGSPVYNKRTGEVVGVMSGTYRGNSASMLRIGNIDPAELNQTSHCISAHYVLEMI